jgi:hypothetical protein
LPAASSVDAASPTPSYVDDFLATSDGLSLTKSFLRIENAKIRRCIVDLAEQIAAGYK